MIWWKCFLVVKVLHQESALHSLSILCTMLLFVRAFFFQPAAYIFFLHRFHVTLNITDFSTASQQQHTARHTQKTQHQCTSDLYLAGFWDLQAVPNSKSTGFPVDFDQNSCSLLSSCGAIVVVPDRLLTVWEIRNTAFDKFETLPAENMSNKYVIKQEKTRIAAYDSALINFHLLCNRALWFRAAVAQHPHPPHLLYWVTRLATFPKTQSACL